MNVIWAKSKWAAADIDQKTIEFRIPLTGGVVEQVGHLSASENPDGLVAVQTVTDAPGKHWAKRIQTIYSLSQEAIDRISRHPDQNTAQFQLH
jgi:hypothetical protein